MGLKECFPRDKENYRFTTFISLVGVIISIISLIISYRTQMSLATPIVDVSFVLLDDKSRYDRVYITSDGRTNDPIKIATYPYLRIVYSLPRESLPDNWTLSYEKYDLDFYSIHQFFIPIIPSYEFYEHIYEGIKGGVIASIQDSEYSLIISNYITETTNYLENNYGFSNVSFSLEYFLELQYKSLLGKDYCDVYRVVTGVCDGDNIPPSVNQIESGMLDHNNLFPDEAKAIDRSIDFEIDFAAPDFNSIYYLLKSEIESYDYIKTPWLKTENQLYYPTKSSHPDSVLKLHANDDQERICSLISDIIFEHHKNIAKKYGITIEITH